MVCIQYNHKIHSFILIKWQNLNDFFSNAGTRGNCVDIGKQVSELGYRVSVKDYIEAIEKTGNEKIRETVEKYTHNKCQVISTVGANENLQDYMLLRNMMYKWF